MLVVGVCAVCSAGSPENPLIEEPIQAEEGAVTVLKQYVAIPISITITITMAMYAAVQRTVLFRRISFSSKKLVGWGAKGGS